MNIKELIKDSELTVVIGILFIIVSIAFTIIMDNQGEKIKELENTVEIYQTFIQYNTFPNTLTIKDKVYVWGEEHWMFHEQLTEDYHRYWNK